MRLGVCTTDFQSMPVEQLFSKVASYGFSAVQLSFGSVLETGYSADGVFEIPKSVSAEALDRIAATARRYSLDIVAVNGTFNMAHPDAAVRNEGVDRFEGFAIAVRQLGCKVVSVCTGTRCRDDLWTWHPDTASDQAWEDMMGVAYRLARIARQNGLVLAVETEASNVIDTPEKARRMIDEIGSDAIGMVMDCANLFHAGTASRQNARAVVRHAFEVFGNDILLAHGKDIRESNGIEFCPTGEGIVDFDDFIQLLAEYNYGGDMLLHGIYDHGAMVQAVQFMNARMKKDPK